MNTRAVAAYEANEAETSLDFQTFFEGPPRPNFLGATKFFRGPQNCLGVPKILWASKGPD